MLSFRNHTVLIASLVFCLASASALLSFRKLASSINQPRDEIFVLQGGRHYWHILDQNQACIGEFNLDFQHSTSSSSLKGEGSFSLKSADQALPFRVTLEMTFNDLGQLGASILKLSSDSTTASIGSTNVAPIYLKVRSQLPNESQSVYDFTIPGPIFVEPINSNAYRLRYRYLDNFAFPPTPALSLSHFLSLKSASEKETCNQQALDVLPLLLQIQSLAQTLPNIDKLVGITK